MHLGISTASFFTKVVTENTFEIMKSMGAEVCEVFLSSFCEHKGEILDSIVANQCLPVHSIHVMTTQFEPELFNRNPRASGDANMILDNVLTAGERLGAKYYTFHGPTTAKRINYNFDFDRLGGIVNGINNKCHAHGIQLSYETVHWAYFNQPDYFARLKERCPDLKATLDIKQCMQADIPWREFADTIGDSLSTVHVCDYDENKKLYIPGRGKFDFVELFSYLKDNGFDGSVIMEVYPEGYQDFEQLHSAYQYLQECMDKIN